MAFELSILFSGMRLDESWRAASTAEEVSLQGEIRQEGCWGPQFGAITALTQAPPLTPTADYAEPNGPLAQEQE